MGSGYTDVGNAGIIISPVADQNLEGFLGDSKIESKRWDLRPFFGCLVSALG